MDYKKRKEEMIRLRKENYTLQQIGDEFGVSRERVRQIVGNTARRTETPLERVINIIEDPMLSDRDIAEIVGSGYQYVAKLRGDKWRVAHKGLWRKHSLSVLRVKKYLESRGFEVEQLKNTPRRFGFDFVVNRKRVICRTIRSEYSPPSKPESIQKPLRKFHVPKNGDADIVAVHVKDDDVDDIFLIPTEDLGGKYRIFAWPKQNSKYAKYRENTDYLK